jgi:hypothetical protein
VYEAGTGSDVTTISADRAGLRDGIDAARSQPRRQHVQFGQQQSACIGEMKPNRVLRCLHADPQWDVFLRKMGLAD